jgi:hypothetical protein
MWPFIGLKLDSPDLQVEEGERAHGVVLWEKANGLDRINEFVHTNAALSFVSASLTSSSRTSASLAQFHYPSILQMYTHENYIERAQAVRYKPVERCRPV